MDRREEETEDGERRIQSNEDESHCKFLELIPLDLIRDILLRLPAKSTVRFRCVSKLWSSITTRPDFIRSFATQSSTRLCLLVSFTTMDKRRFFISFPQHEHPDTCYCPVDRFQIIYPKFDYYSPWSESVHGLMCCGDFCGKIEVWNPTMRQHVTLPPPEPKRKFKRCCLGYDPVEDKYKVLCISGRIYQNPLVFTLGPQESWRVIQNSPIHFFAHSMGRSICINGHVYYEATIRFRVDDTFEDEGILMSFDARYENFNTIRKPADPTLCKFMLNYEGRLAWVCDDFSSLRFWVLEDEEKQEWSLRNFRFPFPSLRQIDPIWEVMMLLMGVTRDTCEFIFVAPRFEAMYVLYYDPKRNRTRRVIYEGIGNKEFRNRNDFKNNTLGDVDWFSNHIENLMSLEHVPR